MGNQLLRQLEESFGQVPEILPGNVEISLRVVDLRRRTYWPGLDGAHMNEEGEKCCQAVERWLKGDTEGRIPVVWQDALPKAGM